MPLTRFLALYGGFGAPRSESQRLQLDLLYFLDDRHAPVEVNYFNRWPLWLRRHPFWANVAFALKLLATPPANVLIDGGLVKFLGLALLVARRFTGHCLIMVPGALPESLASAHSPSLGRLAARWCLGAVHCLLISSEAVWRQLRFAAALKDKLLWVRPYRRRSGAYDPPGAMLSSVSGGRWRAFRVLLEMERGMSLDVLQAQD